MLLVLLFTCTIFKTFFLQGSSQNSSDMDVHSEQVQDAKPSCNFQEDGEQESASAVLSVPCEIKQTQNHTPRTKCVPKCKKEDRTNCSQATDCVSTHHWMETCLEP